jgi:hypothetical protein
MRRLILVLFVIANLALVVTAARESSTADLTAPPVSEKCGASENC